MNIIHLFFNRIIAADLAPVRWMMGILSLFLGTGFVFNGTDTGNYDLINETINKVFLGFIFIAHGITLLIFSLKNYGYYLRCFADFVGIFIWSYVFLSFAFYDRTPIQSTEWLLTIPILMEVWLLAEYERV